MKNFLHTTNNKSGFVILFAVVFSAILLAVSLGVANIAFKEISFTTSARATNSAFLAADTGVECALFNDKEGEDNFIIPNDGEDHPQITCGESTFDVEYAMVNSQPTWTFTIPPANAVRKQCSVVKVTKDNSKYYDKLDIVSKGYNDCDQVFNRVERQLNVSYVVDAIIASDNFTQASDVELSAHTPTGPNRGSGWVAQIVTNPPGIITNKSTGNIIDGNFNNGNRYKMNDNLGSEQMDVKAEFKSTAGPGQNVFFGLMGRLPSGTGTTGIEGYYDFNDINNGASWQLRAGAIKDHLVESWPPTGTVDGVVLMELEIRSTSATLYANGVEKASITFNANTFDNQNYAGILLGNFTNGAIGQVTADNYQSTGFGF
jgi:hypothetical protein